MAGLIPFNRRGLSVRTPQNDLYNMLDDFFNDDWFPMRRNLMSDTFKLDVQETDEGYQIEADMPGVKKEEISLELDHGRLTLGVNRCEEVNEEKKNYIHRERRSSSMQRSIYLADADEGSVKAKLEDGVLKIRVGKQPQLDAGKRIEIE